MSRGHDVDKAVQTMLASVTGHECFILKVDPEPGIPYTVMYPLDSPKGTGSWKDPEEDRDYVYQITSVGEDARQVRRQQEKVERGFLQRGGSGYQHLIGPGGDANVQWRASDRLGAIVASGDKLFKSDDIYRVRVGI